MKFGIGGLLVFASVLAGGSAFAATTDDVKWINQCVQDNKNEGPSADVILKYCTCMTNLMPTSETRSVTQWEKSHHRERAACSRKAGWN